MFCLRTLLHRRGATEGSTLQGHSEKRGRSEGGLRTKSSALDRLTPGFSVITGASWSRRSRNHPCPCKSFCRCNRCLPPCSRPYPCRSSGPASAALASIVIIKHSSRFLKLANTVTITFTPAFPAPNESREPHKSFEPIQQIFGSKRCHDWPSEGD